MLALDYLAAQDDAGKTVILNCGYGRGFSVAEVIEAAIRISGKNFNVTTAGRRLGDPPSLTANSSACQHLLGWVPQADDLDLIVASALAWEQKR